jgi:hypothetical protein
MARAKEIVIAAIIAGCSADPPTAIEAQPMLFAHALCTKLFQCCSLPGDRQQLARWTGNPPDQAFCENAVAQSLSDRLPSVQASLSGGRIGYDEAATRACVTAMERVRCENFAWSSSYPTRGCWKVTGRVLPGGGCVDDVECAGGACNVSSGGIGTCVALPGLGDRCLTRCRAGLVCFFDMCRSVVPKTAGAQCSSSVDCISALCGPQGNSATPTCAPVQACGFFP